MDDVVVQIAFIILLLLGSAFFSAIETAYSTVNMIRLRSMMEDGSKKAKVAVAVISHFDKLIATVLVGNNIVNIALSSLVTVLVDRKLNGSGLALAASTFVTTFLVLTFGEILPKSIGKDNSEFLVLNTAGFVNSLCVVLSPVTAFFIRIKTFMTRNVESDTSPTLTEQELILMLDTIEKEGVLETEEKDLVQSALKFDDTTAQEILTPRVNIVALDVEESKENILATLRREKFSRLPVYRESIDNIIGMVHANELFSVLLDGGNFRLENVIRQCLYVHRTKKIASLLSEFQKKKIQFAVVIDDYGGTLGIVTMEDILEELVGEIWDENDEIVSDFSQVEENRYIVNGDASIEDFFELIGYYPPDYTSDYYTVNGWVLENLENIPVEGDIFKSGILEVKVLKVKDQTAIKVEIIKNSQSDEE